MSQINGQFCAVVLITLTVIISTITAAAVSSIDDDYDEDQLADEQSMEDLLAQNSYVLPKQIFNDGKPFYLEKDPVSGALDFSSKKPGSLASIPNLIDPMNDKDISLNTNSIGKPNFHDFLNLPVKYSSSKFVYPLVSSSYANLKYQGSNKNFISNHKNYTTISPNYHGIYNGQGGPQTTPPPKLKLTTTTTRTTTQRPISTTTGKPILTRPPTKYTTTKYRYSTIRKRPYTPSTEPTTHSVDNRSKLEVIPLDKKERITTTMTTTTSTTLEHSRPTNTKIENISSSTEYYVRYTPSPPTSPSTTITPTPIPSWQSTTVRKSEPAFKPLPSTTVFTTPNPLDLYANMNNKKEEKDESLSELLNSLMQNDISASSPSGFKQNKFISTSPQPVTSQPNRQISNKTQQNQFNPNNYVSYKVQQPTMGANQLKPQSVASISNIIISPNQNSATFVLGSQQSVKGNGQQKKEPDNLLQQSLLVSGSYQTGNTDSGSNSNQYQFGTVLNEERPHGFAQINAPNVSINKTGTGQNLNKIKNPTIANNGVRFPTEDNFENAPIVKGTYSNEIAPPNGHSAPIALPHTGNNNLVVFPPNRQTVQATIDNAQQVQPGFVDVTKRIVFTPDVNTNVNLNQNYQLVDNRPNYEVMQHNHPPPPNYQPNDNNLIPPNDDLIRRPQFPQAPNYQPKQDGNINQRPPFGYTEFTRKPMPPHPRPLPERLPNILPQFRPNAKIGQVQHGQHLHYPNSPPPPGFVRQSAQNGRFPTKQSTNGRPPPPPPPPPPHFRRTPSPNMLFNQKMSGSVEKPDQNRRHFHVRPPINERNIPQPPFSSHQQPQRRYVDGYPTGGVHFQRKNSPVIESAQPKSDNVVYDSHDYNRNPPRRSIDESKTEEIRPILEPVVTLQMIQHKKFIEKEQGNLIQSQPFTVDQQIAVKSASDKPPIYVVYPVKTSPLKLDVISSDGNEEPVVVGLRGEQPLPPSEIGTNDYQNTPFSVVRQEEEPILMVKQKPSMYPFQNTPKFPYPMEKPNPLANREFDFLKNKFNHLSNKNQDRVELMGRVVNRGGSRPNKIDDVDDDYTISSSLSRVTDSPIAIAYTPTEPNSNFYNLHDDSENYGQIPNHQLDVDEFGHPIRENYEQQNFQAPFYPSVNLASTPSSGNRNGWAVVTTGSSKPTSISTTATSLLHDRIDNNNSEPIPISEPLKQKMDETSSKFDANNFHPEFESGFRPIYPTNTKTTTLHLTPVQVDKPQPEHKNSVPSESPSSTERPLKDVKVDMGEKKVGGETMSSTTKKPVIESLASLLFGLDDEYEGDDYESTTTDSR